MVRFEALQSKGEVDRMLSSPLSGLKGAILNGLILAMVPWAVLAQDTDGDGVGDIDDLYPEDSARSVNSPFFLLSTAPLISPRTQVKAKCLMGSKRERPIATRSL